MCGKDSGGVRQCLLCITIYPYQGGVERVSFGRDCASDAKPFAWGASYQSVLVSCSPIKA
jgi:hypothetical protein